MGIGIVLMGQMNHLFATSGKKVKNQKIALF
jgi:hypothetical protein